MRNRHQIKPLYLFERTARAWLVKGPRKLFRAVPLSHRILNVGFAYVLFQVLGLLWAFLINAASSLALDTTGLFVSHAFGLGGEWPTLTTAAATLYTVYSTFRVFARLAGAVNTLAQESLDNFPSVVKLVRHGPNFSWTHSILVLFIPQFLLVASLLVAPRMCDESSPYATSLVCLRTPIYYMTASFPSARHTLKLVVLVGLIQYFQVLLQCFPNWRHELACGGNHPHTHTYTSTHTSTSNNGSMHNINHSRSNSLTNVNPSSNPNPSPTRQRGLQSEDSTSSIASVNESNNTNIKQGGLSRNGNFRTRNGVINTPTKADTHASVSTSNGQSTNQKGAPLTVRMALHCGLMACFSLTVIWLLFSILTRDVAARLLGLRIRPFKDLGLWLLLAWTLWVLSVAIVLCHSGSPPRLSSAQLRELFMHIKASLAIICNGVFWWCFLKPSIGFLEAQRELIVLTTLVPLIYVLIYQMLSTAVNLSKTTFFCGIVAAVGVSSCLCHLSAFGGQGTVYLVALHIFSGYVEFFAVEIPDLPSNSPTQPTTHANKHSSTIPEDSTTDYNDRNNEKSKAGPPRSSRSFRFLAGLSNASLGDRSSSFAGDSTPLRRLRNMSQREILGNLGGSCLDLLSDATARVGNFIHNESHGFFMYSTLTKAAVGTGIAFFTFMASGHMLSLIQHHRGWYFPSSIEVVVNRYTKEVLINNGQVSTAVLEKTKRPSHKPSLKSPSPRYAICDMKPGGFSMLDYALMAELAYFDCDRKEAMDEVLDQFFPPSPVSGLPFFPAKLKNKLHVVVPPEEYRSESFAHFIEIRKEDTDISVVAVRGTNLMRPGDFIEDVKIWTEPVVFTLLSAVFPTVRIWPDSIASAVIEWLHTALQLFGLESSTGLHYHLLLLDYVQKLKREGRHVIVTGHSLGGGLAQVVGLLAGVQSVCFSPPGIGRSYQKFQHSSGAAGVGLGMRRKLHGQSVAIVHEHDVVPTIDTQVGLVQTIYCGSERKSLMACHMIEATVCELVNNCGDPRGRFHGCAFDFAWTNLLEGYSILPAGPDATSTFMGWLAVGAIGFFVISMGLLIWLEQQ